MRGRTIPLSRRDWDEAHLINTALDIHHPGDPVFWWLTDITERPTAEVKLDLYTIRSSAWHGSSATPGAAGSVPDGDHGAITVQSSLPHRRPAMQPTRRAASFGIDQRCDCRMAAQFVQTPATGGPDAANRDAQFGADLGIRHRRILDEHADQLLTAG